MIGSAGLLRRRSGVGGAEEMLGPLARIPVLLDEELS
jgi:hypothetical protein